MIQILAGMALGWLAFTEEGRKAADGMTKKVMKEASKTLKNMGILEDDDKPEKSAGSD